MHVTRSSLHLAFAFFLISKLFKQKPVFVAKTELAQLDVIFRTCGTPTIATWPGINLTPNYKSVMPKKIYPRMLKETFRPYA